MSVALVAHVSVSQYPVLFVAVAIPGQHGPVQPSVSCTCKNLQSAVKDPDAVFVVCLLKKLGRNS